MSVERLKKGYNSLHIALQVSCRECRNSSIYNVYSNSKWQYGNIAYIYIYIYLKCIFRHFVPISIKNVSFDTQDIVPFTMCKLLYAVFDLSTLKTFFKIFRHSRHCTIHILCLSLIFQHSRHCTIHILCVNYCMLSLSNSRHCTIHILCVNYCMLDTQDIYPFLYLGKCIRHCTIPISIKNASFTTQDIVPLFYV